MKIERRETLRAEMQPDMYDGPECDQMAPRWWTYGADDKEGGFEHEPLTLDAKLFPPGTIISVKEPVCPTCKEAREPIYKNGKYLPGFKSKCRCGFDWDAWTGDEYS